MTDWQPALKAQMLLLEKGQDAFKRPAIGTGIITISGSARCG